MTVVEATTDPALHDRAQSWLGALEAALGAADPTAFDALFLERSFWRDLVALGWDTSQWWGRNAIRDAMVPRAAAAGLRDLQLDPDRSAPKWADFMGAPNLEVFYTFRTAVGTGKGFVRLQADETTPTGLRALMISTALVALDCAPEPTERHPKLGFDPEFPGQTYGEWRVAKSAFTDHDPDVLIIGGSHSGLSVGARFERKGASYLIVEKHANPGDMWRGRYEALALHTPTPMNHLPYIPLPDIWSQFTPKDQWADWLDCYQKLMNLNFWGNTEALGATWDDATRTWSVTLRMPDGSERVMHPKHVVLAVGGVGGRPRIPELPGLADFAGETMHSSRFGSGAAYAGKRVMVVGASTTAHDLCLDLASRGADVTMAQRGATCVVNISEVLFFGSDYSRISTDEADFLRSSMTLPLMIERAQAYTRTTEASHRELHDGLRAAGQKLTIGHDDTGWSIKLFREAAGYYLNVGASEAIVDGRIKVQDYDEIECFVPEGARLKDGTVVGLDVVVLATGFYDLSNDIEAILGPEVAARIGRCNGVAEDGEYRTMSRPTAQPHLWLINGGIVDSRKSSDVLALQVIAQMEGLTPTLVRSADGTAQPL